MEKIKMQRHEEPPRKLSGLRPLGVVVLLFLSGCQTQIGGKECNHLDIAVNQNGIYAAYFGRGKIDYPIPEANGGGTSNCVSQWHFSLKNPLSPLNEKIK